MVHVAYQDTHEQQVDLLVATFYSHPIPTWAEATDNDDSVADNIFYFTRTLH